MRRDESGRDGMEMEMCKEDRIIRRSRPGCRHVNLAFLALRTESSLPIELGSYHGAI